MSDPINNIKINNLERKVDKQNKSFTTKLKDNKYSIIAITILFILVLILFFFVFIHHASNDDNHKTNFLITSPIDGTSPGNFIYNLDNDSSVIVINEDFRGTDITINYTGNIENTGYMYLFKNTTSNNIMLIPGTNVIISNGNTRLQTAACNSVLTYNNPNIPATAIPLPGGSLVKLVLMSFTTDTPRNVTLLQL